MSHTLSRFLVTQAYNNAWANHRLLKACSLLSQEEFEASGRSSFFPSIKHTLNHILTVDWFYIDALEREAGGEEPHPDYVSFFRPEQPFGTCAALAEAQRDSDRRLIAYCEQLDDGQVGNIVRIQRGDVSQCETRVRLLAHVFEHQIHHRGQVHTMLSGTSAAPPQLDEFFCTNDTALRAEDFRELGWTEEQVWHGANG